MNEKSTLAIIVLTSTAVLVGAANLLVSITSPASTPRLNESLGAIQSNVLDVRSAVLGTESKGMTAENGTEWRTFDAGEVKNSISFGYPNGWHVAGTFDAEGTSTPTGDVTFELSPEPLVKYFPSEGQQAPVTISKFDGTVPVSRYPESEVAAMKTIDVNGHEATWLHHENSDDPRMPRYEDLVFVKVNGRIAYRLHHEYADANDANIPAWTHLLDTFAVN